MRTDASVPELIDAALRRKERARHRRDAKWHTLHTDRVKFFSAQLECRMKLGDTLIGAAVTMTGIEMLRRNRRLRDKFFDTCLSNPSSRLMQWKIVKRLDP